MASAINQSAVYVVNPFALKESKGLVSDLEMLAENGCARVTKDKDNCGKYYMLNGENLYNLTLKHGLTTMQTPENIYIFNINNTVIAAARAMDLGNIIRVLPNPALKSRT